jgi:hypothetical protein
LKLFVQCLPTAFAAGGWQARSNPKVRPTCFSRTHTLDFEATQYAKDRPHRAFWPSAGRRKVATFSPTSSLASKIRGPNRIPGRATASIGATTACVACFGSPTELFRPERRFLAIPLGPGEPIGLRPQALDPCRHTTVV